MEQDAFTITEQDIELLRFVVKDGKKEIQNIKISPLLDNFDYVGGGGKFKGWTLEGIKAELKKWGITILNEGFEELLDPSKIGRTVSIEFKGGVRLVDINEEEFKYLQAKKELLDWGERILQPEIISDKMAVFFEGI